MAHESRLQQSLRELIEQRRTAALATSSLEDPDAASAQLAAPLISMVPFAWCAEFGCIVLHVSALAIHTRAMERHPAVSLLFSAPETPGEAVHALERVSLQGVASTPPRDSVLHTAARATYVQRFPEAEFMTGLPDFRFVCITPLLARHVAGFGSARDVDANDFTSAMNFQAG
ncbi:pyridoxamine 5'-phosphate oxidase family protein [Diaphorobacter aerolatus]|uniref:Pyridoxamine 5'-phosphate oxidase family protein n=1 Tax=Diaphorobacter aerolatus TaxID=1288495 RepID=A0A7H0GKA3_9BURK|nr:pyridoxamine 5'-phosphate oxidase family protein [Diaphorobacter aerolatus]QNP48719.1 pyridoxamine 5'-phosphate oxidase family protein [Diaphorobacter aerolatus]